MQVRQYSHAFFVHIHIQQPTRRFGNEERTKREDRADDALDEEGAAPGEVGEEEGGKVVNPLGIRSKGGGVVEEEDGGRRR